jgi:hypothetical protein
MMWIGIEHVGAKALDNSASTTVHKSYYTQMLRCGEFQLGRTSIEAWAASQTKFKCIG